MAIEINSMLRIYNYEEYMQFLRGYPKGDYKHTIMYVIGDYIPSWFYETTDTIEDVYLEVLDKSALSNGTITALSSTEIIAEGYNTSDDNGKVYADKQAYTLTAGDVYRLYIDTNITDLYSELFKKIR